MKNKRFIFVIGAHRSGTSLLASLIGSMGAVIGSEQLDTNGENLKGFWENRLLVELNDEVLRDSDLSWDMLHLPEGMDFSHDRYQLHRDKAKLILASQFHGAPVALIKDPRLCFLMPFWLKVVEEIGVLDVKAVILYREPSEVVASQQMRAKKDPEFHLLGAREEQVYLHWYTSMRSALKVTSCLPVYYIRHQSLLEKRLPVVESMLRFLGFEPSQGEIERQLNETVEPALYRNRSSGGYQNIPYEFVKQLAYSFEQADEGVDGLCGLHKVENSISSELARSTMDELQKMYGQSYKKLLEVRHHLLLHMQKVESFKSDSEEMERIVRYQESHIQLLERSVPFRLAKVARKWLAGLGMIRKTK
ncbi:hypothetical protein FT643_16680 [Ketobacter sp. MCCC 1A13808]|uniref:sulfotransferase family protein n=1 Tax=Ketobacter sp. MCCC 1A13808 TaxID=2602738 RepID=UPI0012EC2234|nr:sulfotransferase [Ketobacter sp. MCCC 1A13808]MVF13778.1 hypothetical protein [Ketobacter sp. MCCC 1A13808]